MTQRNPRHTDEKWLNLIRECCSSSFGNHGYFSLPGTDPNVRKTELPIKLTNFLPRIKSSQYLLPCIIECKTTLAKLWKRMTC